MRLFGIFFFLFLSQQSFANDLNAIITPPKEVLPDLGHSDYRKIWKEYIHFKKGESIDPQIEEAIAAGEKLFRWVRLINDDRSDETKIKLSDATTLKGIPIDQPLNYSPRIIGERVKQLKNDLNQEMLNTLFGNTQAGPEIKTNDEEFTKFARIVARAYDHAVRWQTNMLPYLSYYKENAKKDIRGFYYLSKISNLDTFLKELPKKPQDIIVKNRTYLKNICLNYNPVLNNCDELLNVAFKKGKLVNFKDKYWPAAQRNWNSFFAVTSPRTDIIWNEINRMSLQFTDPNQNEIRDFLKINIEDEFQFTTKEHQLWKFKLGFEAQAGSPYIVFQAGATPHVSYGNVIYMDANIDLNDYENNWVIRHEFGHVLRLPDCYVEFYDEKNETAVTYQLDTSDLMCSRSGKFNQRIFSELKKNYFKTHATQAKI